RSQIVDAGVLGKHGGRDLPLHFSVVLDLADEMTVILLILETDVLEQILIRLVGDIHADGPRLRVALRIVEGHVVAHVAEVGVGSLSVGRPRGRSAGRDRPRRGPRSGWATA